jgi:nicotinamidase-related amidase
VVDLGRSDIFVDVCMQREYLGPEAARRCQNAEQLTFNARRLMAYARWSQLPVVSCVDCRRPNQIDDEFAAVSAVLPPVSRKAAYTLLPDHATVESDNCLCVPLDVLKAHQQTIFPKYHRDPFTNPKLDRLLTEMPAGRFIVFGIPLETSVRILALGLLRRGRSVVVIEDACGYWSAQEASMVMRQLHVKGCTTTTAESFVQSELVRRLASRNGNVRGNGHAHGAAPGNGLSNGTGQANGNGHGRANGHANGSGGSRPAGGVRRSA